MHFNKMILVFNAIKKSNNNYSFFFFLKAIFLTIFTLSVSSGFNNLWLAYTSIILKKTYSRLSRYKNKNLYITHKFQPHGHNNPPPINQKPLLIVNLTIKKEIIFLIIIIECY